MKKKFFVLRKDTGPNHPARLEYYDSEKKFLAGIPPKKWVLTIVGKFSGVVTRTPEIDPLSVLDTHQVSIVHRSTT